MYVQGLPTVAGIEVILDGVRRAFTDDRGRYRFEDVKEGRYTLTVEHPTRRMPQEFPLALREGESVDVETEVGAWRTLDAGQPIDPSGVTNDGTQLEDIGSLRELTVQNGDLFAQSVTEKLLTYAIGRGLGYEDMPLVRSITRNAAEHDYRFSALLMGVIRSPAFTMNVKSGASEE